MTNKPFTKLKDDDKMWAIESAASTLKEFARIKRDPGLFKAARAELKKQLVDTKKAITI